MPEIISHQFIFLNVSYTFQTVNVQHRCMWQPSCNSLQGRYSFSSFYAAATLMKTRLLDFFSFRDYRASASQVSLFSLQCLASRGKASQSKDWEARRLCIAPSRNQTFVNHWLVVATWPSFLFFFFFWTSNHTTNGTIKIGLDLPAQQLCGIIIII